MAWAPLVIGLLLGLAAIGTMTFAGILHERGTWVATIVAIAAFYVVFAVEADGMVTILVQTGLAASFVALAVLGARGSAWLLVAALVLHGVFDGAASLFPSDPAPDWWSAFCLGVDGMLGIGLAILILRRGLGPRPSQGVRPFPDTR